MLAPLNKFGSKYRSLVVLMDERMRRRWAATEAKAYGWGGVRAVSYATGMSANTIRKGLAELGARKVQRVDARVRSAGAGRKRCLEIDPELRERLEQLVDPVTRGDPQSPLRWTCKSTTHLAECLRQQGHAVSPRTVGRLLNAAGYSLQSNRKTLEGAGHPDRNAQFEHINASVIAFQQRGQPVISRAMRFVPFLSTSVGCNNLSRMFLGRSSLMRCSAEIPGPQERRRHGRSLAGRHSTFVEQSLDKRAAIHASLEDPGSIEIQKALRARRISAMAWAS